MVETTAETRITSRDVIEKYMSQNPNASAENVLAYMSNMLGPLAFYQKLQFINTFFHINGQELVDRVLLEVENNEPTTK